MIHVLDACAMIAFLRGEDGAPNIAALLKDSATTCVAHSVNLCEVYYDFLQAADEDTAKSAIEDLRKSGVVERADIDEPFWEEVGKYKAGQLRSKESIALADCFTVALAVKTTGQVVTSDRREFDPIAKKGICSVSFFR